MQQRKRNLSITLVAMIGLGILFLIPGCGEDDEVIVAPKVPPNEVEDFRVVGIGGGYVQFSWTIVGDANEKPVGRYHFYQAVDRPVSEDSLDVYETSLVHVWKDVGTEIQWRWNDAPDGAMVFFAMRSEDKDGVFSGLSNSCFVTTPKRVTEMPENVGNITFSPDGGLVAYVRYIPYAPFQLDFQIEVRPVDGSRPWVIVEESEDPDWSPDGSMLAYSLTNNQLTGYVYAVSSAGGSPILVAASAYKPTWSPDGNSIAVQAYMGGWDIYLKRINSPGVDKRIADSGHLAPWDWSPDSRFLLCTNRGEESEIAVVAVEDGEITRHDLGSRIIQARWSPSASDFVVAASDGISLIRFPSFHEEKLTLSGTSPNWLAGRNDILFLEDDYIWSVQVPLDWN